ncbi:MAG: hypothetical protein ACR2RV_23645, partial [Verrucomicrobiales bacterium]
IYINGVETLRVNMPGGAIDATTFASSGVEVEELSGDIPVSAAGLTAGTNRISVEVHQESASSSDIVFGLELDAEIAGTIPGAAPQIALNEVPPATGASFWVELTNASPAAVELGGMKLSAAADPGREYTLPASQLAPGGLLLVDEASLGFRPADGEKLILYDAAGATVLDARQVTGRLRGLSSNGDWLYPSAETPGSPNTFQFNSDIVISEIAYNPPGLAPTPTIPPGFDVSQLVPMNSVWRYNHADEDLPAGWAASMHPTGGNWEEGTAPIGRETGTLDFPLVTAWDEPPYSRTTVTTYFETEFTVAAQDLANIDSLEITHQIDDGAVFYLNGTEIGRFNMPAGAINSETLASPGVGNASPITVEVPLGSLVSGS